ncbi:MAG: DNA mismatch repair protein MutT, partial [Bacilli bacterium]
KRHLVILFKTNSFSGSLLPSKEGEVFWIKEEELTSYELAPDTYEIYLIMKNENVSELYIEGDRKKIM